MCQLTLIEFKDQRLAKLIIRPLTEINTVGISTFANNDGFGYVCFSNLDNIIKTKESAQNWWTDNKTQLLKHNKNIKKNYNTKKIKTTKIEESSKIHKNISLKKPRH